MTQEEKKNYRPLNIEFDILNNSMLPEVLGDFESLNDIDKFIAENELTTINEKVTVYRNLDAFEKSELRKEYQELLETFKPKYVDDLNRAEMELLQAKEKVKNAKENLNANGNLIDALAMEVKGGVREITLDYISTFKLPYRGKNYYYTYINGSLVLCKIREFDSDEKTSLYGAGANNSRFIEDNYLQKIDE